jgi:hypothetical protein
MFNNRGLDILKLYKNALTINLLFTFGSGPNVTTYIENNKETQASVSVRTISTVTSPTDISMINPLNSSYIYKLDTGTPIISNAFVPVTIDNRIDVRDCSVTFPTFISTSYTKPI